MVELRIRRKGNASIECEPYLNYDAAYPRYAALKTRLDRDIDAVGIFEKPPRARKWSWTAYAGTVSLDYLAP